MANKERLLILADAIENRSVPDMDFKMDGWFSEIPEESRDSYHGCGTVGCIAGWAGVVFAKKFTGRYSAAGHLGLTGAEADRLFLPHVVGSWEKLTPEVAVRCLRNFAATDQIEWFDAINGIEHYPEPEKLAVPANPEPELLPQTTRLVLA